MAAQSSSLMTPSLTLTVQRSSAWHTPVPYLFGGLAVLMGLISFALLILACSYWKLSRNLDNDTDTDTDTDRDIEVGNNKILPVFEEKYLVIMAGQDKPTFLATPSSSRTSSFSSCSCPSGSTMKKEGSSARVIEGDERNESAYQVSQKIMFF